jgi:hypothetical protein
MAGGGVQGFRELQKRFNDLNRRLQAADADAFCRSVAKELAARLLAQALRTTPVGDYDKPVDFTTKDGKHVSFQPHTGKKGGTLRRGWTAKTEAEAMSGSGKGSAAAAAAYAKALPITKSGNVYEIEIINPVRYASYVEFGHRTGVGDGWVQGHRMLAISEKAVQRWADAGNIEKKLLKYLREVFDGD